MAFRGQYEHSLDSKDRLTVPARLREELTDRPVVVKGPDACLWLMPEESFSGLSDQYIEPHSPFSANARKLRRLFNSGASECEVDSAGRIRIPRHLADSAGLDGACAVVGAGTYIEIWNAGSWKTENENLQAEFDEIAEGMSGSVE